VSDCHPKLIPIDKETNHQVVHAFRLGEAQRAADKPLDPSPQIDVFSFRHDRVGTDVQHPCGVTSATRIQGHLDDLLFDCRRLPWVTILQQERTPLTALFSAPVPLLALPGLAMANDVGPGTVRTVQDLENHAATQSHWG
jgi:hypothetical protein